MTPGVTGHVGDDDVAECQCGGDRFHVVYKAPVYAVVEAGEVVRVVVADESVDGPLVSECTECGPGRGRDEGLAGMGLRSVTTPALRDRIAGALLGLAAGDALGATVEFLSPADIRRRGRHSEICGGGVFGWRVGQGTDDTDLAYAVARTYVEGYSLAGVAERSWPGTPVVPATSAAPPPLHFASCASPAAPSCPGSRPWPPGVPTAPGTGR